MADEFDPYYKWLQIPPTEQPPNYYRLLGLPLFESDPEVIENATDQRMAHIRTFQTGKYSARSQTILNELAAAKVCLLDFGKKRAYDAKLTQARSQIIAARAPVPASDAGVTEFNSSAFESADLTIPSTLFDSVERVQAQTKHKKQNAIILPAAILAGGAVLVLIGIALLRSQGPPEPLNAKQPQEKARSTQKSAVKKVESPTKVSQTDSRPPATEPTSTTKVTAPVAVPPTLPRVVAQKTIPIAKNVVPPVYLDDLQEVAYSAHENKFGKHGTEPNAPRIWFLGKPLTHSLFMHPPGKGSSFAVYQVSKKYATFRAKAALRDVPMQVIHSASPLTFQLIGDGKVIWKSRPMSRLGEFQECEVSVVGVDLLRLQVACPGRENYAWALWIEPLLIGAGSEPTHADADEENGDAGEGIADQFGETDEPNEGGRRGNQRIPVPHLAKLDRAREEIEDALGDGENLTPEKHALRATEVLAMAEEESKEDRWYALVEDAIRHASRAGQIDDAMAAADLLAGRFEIDALAKKIDILREVSALPKRTPAQNESLITQGLSLCNTAIDDDNYVVAEQALQLTDSTAKRAKNGTAIKEVTVQRERLIQLAKASQSLQSAVEILKSEPDNPEANAAVGEFQCFLKGQWDAGLPKLAKGDRPELKQLATEELANPTDANAQVALADAWWDFASTQTDMAKQHCLERSAHWYGLAVDELVGLDKHRVISRLKSPELANIQTETSSAPTDKAIAAGLQWLAKRQRDDGSWNFNGPNKGTLDAPRAATAMALLPFLRSGQTHQKGEHRAIVAKGVGYLIGQLKVSQVPGDLRDRGSTMYGQALATMALCDAYGKSGDSKLKKPAQLAIDFIVAAQDPVGGGWRYSPRETGDTSVLGWQLGALHSALGAKMRVPKGTLVGAARFLDSVQIDGGRSYSYQGGGGGTPAMSAIGLLGRIRTGGRENDPEFAAGFKTAMSYPATLGNVYHLYYVMHLASTQNTEESRQWKKEAVETLLKGQNGDGGWILPNDAWGKQAGDIYTTSLALLSLIAAD